MKHGMKRVTVIKSVAINFAPMADHTNDDLFRLRIGKIKHAIISNANAPAVAVFQFLATVRKRILFQRQNRLGDTGLKLGGDSREFFAGIAGDFNLPIHARMLSSFNACRNDWRG